MMDLCNKNFICYLTNILLSWTVVIISFYISYNYVFGPTISYFGQLDENLYGAYIESNMNKTELNVNMQAETHISSVSDIKTEKVPSKSFTNQNQRISLQTNEKISDPDHHDSSLLTRTNDEKLKKPHADQKNLKKSQENSADQKTILQKNVESTSGEKFQNEGASIIYVHTFCLEIIGDQATSLLEKCRAEMKLKCDIDVLSWFKNNPLLSTEALS